MSHFIRTNFSLPEKNPVIRTYTKLVRTGQRNIWRIEFVEKDPWKLSFFPGKEKLMRIAILDVDSSTGHIINRRFFNPILESEYGEIFQKPKKSGRRKDFSS